MKNNILYITWGETIVDFGIFKNQVLEQLKLIKKERPELKLFLLSGIPIGNKKLFKNPSSFIRELKDIRSVCKENGITFSWRWLPVLSPWFYTPPSKLNFYDLFQTRYIKNFLIKNAIEIAHCRSYTATRVLLKTRKEFSQLQFKIIFDTRGNFPEEGKLKSFFNENDYKIWKGIEKKLFNDSDAVVNVSDTFTDYVKSLTENPAVYTIYTSTNLSIFQRIEIGERKKLREKYSIRQNEKVLIYLGDIGENGWHDKRNLFALYQSFRKTFEAAKLLLITRNSRLEFEESFLEMIGNPDELMVIKGANPKEVNILLNMGDYGSLPFKKVNDPLDKILGYTMIASKTGEYLACGLPIITNSEIGAASKLVKEGGIGIVYESGNEQQIQKLLLKIESNKEEIIDKCIETSKRFDAKKNAELYIRIYEKLMNNKKSFSEINI